MQPVEQTGWKNPKCWRWVRIPCLSSVALLSTRLCNISSCCPKRASWRDIACWRLAIGLAWESLGESLAGSVLSVLLPTEQNRESETRNTLYTKMQQTNDWARQEGNVAGEGRQDGLLYSDSSCRYRWMRMPEWVNNGLELERLRTDVGTPWGY